MSYNQISFLPDLSNCQLLQHLIASHNELRAIPSLSSCKSLNLSHNRITILTDLSNCEELYHINVSNNQITSLPDLRSCKRLRQLFISNNQLTSLPNTLIALPRSLIIFMGGNFLSDHILTNLRNALNHQDYQGPRISYSIRENAKNKEDSLTTYQLLESIARDTEEPTITLDKNLQESASLKLWLSRLSYMADYNTSPIARIALLKKVLQYVKLATTNQDFCHLFLATIENAATTCGDRMVLSMLYLGIQYTLTTIDKSNPQELSRILRGVHALNLLETVAREKVRSLSFFDEIEVYLAYPIKLKEALDLPITVNDMLYFKHSSIDAKELEVAKEFVLSTIENQDNHCKFLITQEPWLEYLRSTYPQEIEVLGQKLHEYTTGLIHITKQALLA